MPPWSQVWLKIFVYKVLVVLSIIGTFLTYFIYFFSYAMTFRKQNLETFIKKYGIKLGFMSIFSKASAYALQDQPVVNAVIDGTVNTPPPYPCPLISLLQLGDVA